MDRKLHKVVVVADFAHAAGRNFFAGILDFARTRSDWQVSVLQRSDEFSTKAIDRMEWDGTDGIITTEIPNENVRSRLDASTVPLVIVGSHRRGLPSRETAIAYVTVDETNIGAVAAEYLSGLGAFRSYAFVHYTEAIYSHVSVSRKRGFKVRLARDGLALKSFDDTTGDPSHLVKWLTDLPKPAAILAGEDKRAAEVLHACAQAKLSVPDQVMVLGIDNDELICLSCTPQLTSLLPGAEDEGRAAAFELDRIMRNPAKAKSPRSIVCKTSVEIVRRGSTETVKPATHLISKALAFIEGNASRPISVRDVVSHIRVSRRLAELRFRELLNRGIRETIMDARLKHLSRRLRISHDPVSAICRQCGFTNVPYVSTAFKRKFGRTMNAYRSDGK